MLWCICCSIATSLGSRTICEQLFLYSKNHSVHSVVVSDKEAVQACLKFSGEKPPAAAIASNLQL